MKYMVFLAVAGLAVSACGNSGHGSGTSPTTTPTETSTPTTPDPSPPPATPETPTTPEPPATPPTPTAIPPAPWPPPEPPVMPEAPAPALVPKQPMTTNVPPGDYVTVGGPPSQCKVYEWQVPIEANDGAHMPQNSKIKYANNPPTSGPNYEMWADYRQYWSPILRPHWVHNLRHGAIVLAYRPDAPRAVIDALSAAYAQIPTPVAHWSNPDCPAMGIMTPDPELLHDYAVLAWGWIMTSNCVPQVKDVVDFATRHIFLAPEKECYPGAFPVRLPCYRFEDAPKPEWTRQVPEGTPVTYDHNPPTSGPFYDKVLKYGRYDKVVPAPYWTGIVVKGGVVVLYRPDAPPALIKELEDDFDALPPYWKCGHPMVAMVQDPTLDHYFAYVATNQYMAMQCTQGWPMYGFVSSRQGYGLFESCDDGNWTPP